MSDNLRRYRAIRDALTQGYPSEPQGHVARYLTTLAALISGIVGSKRTQLPHIATHVPDGTKAESRIKRFARWVDNAHILEEADRKFKRYFCAGALAAHPRSTPESPPVATPRPRRLRRAQRGSPAGALVGRLASSGRRISLTSHKLSQQYLRLLEVGGIEAFSEPAVHLRQQLVGLLAFALLLPQAAQAQRRLQLSGFGLLMAGHSEGLLKAGFGRGRMKYGT